MVYLINSDARTIRGAERTPAILIKRYKYFDLLRTVSLPCQCQIGNLNGMSETFNITMFHKDLEKSPKLENAHDFKKWVFTNRGCFIKGACKKNILDSIDKIANELYGG